MELGIFAKTFARRTLGETLDAVLQHGLRTIQFNLVSAGLPTLPESLAPETSEEVRRETVRRGISIAAISGTFNMIHPEQAHRERGLAHLRHLILNCRKLGTSTVTLCAGTRDPENMWRAHPDNCSREAWNDLLASLSVALSAADETSVTLAVEPETGSVLGSAPACRKLLNELRSPRLKVIIDPANLLEAGNDRQQCDVLREAFDLLGTDILLAHAKELGRDGSAGEIGPGKGILDWEFYLSELARIGFEGPLIVHGLKEEQVADCLAFLRERLSAHPGLAQKRSCSAEAKK